MRNIICFKIYPLLLLITLFLPKAAFSSGHNQPNTLTIFNWQPDVQYYLQQSQEGMGENPGQALFDDVANINIVQFGNSATHYGVRLGRAVFDNHDVLHSYTVADAITLPVKLYSLSQTIGNTPLSLNLGFGGSLDFLDLRQVTKGGLGHLDSLDARAQQIGASPWYQTGTANSSNDSWFGFNLDSLNSALFYDMWNIVAFPARLPFKADWVQKLDIGEVIAYGAFGYAEFGPSVGIVLNTDALSSYIDSLNMSADLRYFVNGAFHIAILREDANHVRVKIVTDTESGTRYGTAAAGQNARLFDGFMVLGLEIKPTVSVMPFNFQNVNGSGNVMEQGFRFDLRDPDARAAYEQAVIGRFAAADKLAVAAASANQPNAPVQSLFHKDATDENQSEDHGLRIVLFSMDRGSQTQTTNGILTLPDGKHKVFENVVENDFHSIFLFGGREKIVTRTTIDFADSVLGLVLEGWIEDQITDGQELRAYESEVERVIDRGQIFPVMPLNLPAAPTDGGSDTSAPALAHYGASDFYFRMEANQAMINKFIQVSEDDKWKVLEKVFEIPEGIWEDSVTRAGLLAFTFVGKAVNIVLSPLDIHIRCIERLFVANAIHDNWASLASIQDPQELTKALGKQFADSFYGFEMMQVFTSAIKGENLPFYLTANNQSFGTLNIQEGEFTTVQSLKDYRAAANFEHPGPQPDINLAVNGFAVNILDANSVEVLFTASAKPQYLYFRLDSTDILPVTKSELVVLNTGFASAGTNRIVLDQRDSGYSGVLAKALMAAPGNYTLNFALGAESHDWGPVVSVGVTVNSLSN